MSVICRLRIDWRGACIAAREPQEPQLPFLENVGWIDPEATRHIEEEGSSRQSGARRARARGPSCGATARTPRGAAGLDTGSSGNGTCDRRSAAILAPGPAPLAPTPLARRARAVLAPGHYLCTPWVDNDVDDLVRSSMPAVPIADHHEILHGVEAVPALPPKARISGGVVLRTQSPPQLVQAGAVQRRDHQVAPHEFPRMRVALAAALAHGRVMADYWRGRDVHFWAFRGWVPLERVRGLVELSTVEDVGALVSAPWASMSPAYSLASSPGSSRGSDSELHPDKESSIAARDPKLVPSLELDSDAIKS